MPPLFRPTHLLSIIALMSCVTACSGAQKRSDAVAVSDPEIEKSMRAPSPENSEPDLAPGFLIQLSSTQDAKLNGSFRVQADGKIELPYQVTVQTGGKSLDRFREELLQKYRPYFKSSPSLSVSVKQKRYYVEIRGLISEPGTYLVKRDSQLDEILSLAGGLTEDLRTAFVRIEQGKRTFTIDLNDYFKHGDTANVPAWRGGERIFLQKERPVLDESAPPSAGSRTVQVMGEVRNPGEVSFIPNADIYHYLSKTGGPTQTADLDEIEVVRINDETKVRDRFQRDSLDDIGGIQDGDLIIVHAIKQSRTERALQTTATISSIITAILLILVTAL